jgi:hypothetical protein
MDNITKLQNEKNISKQSTNMDNITKLQKQKYYKTKTKTKRLWWDEDMQTKTCNKLCEFAETKSNIMCLGMSPKLCR